jgi:signal transduction histidine kinase
MDELGQLTTTFNLTLERLERLFVAQRRFVADVSHELRTPLTTIQGNLDLIKRVGPDETSLEAIESEVKRMTRLVGDLLMLAQADSGRLPLHEEPVELGTLALEVYRQAKVLAVDVELKLGAVEAVRVMGDPDRLKQLLLNLVTNALKYTPSGGKVSIAVKQEAGDALMIVADTGTGIPKEDIPYIFDRFYRVDKARARQMGGSGLGLSIAQWIAEVHRGRIRVESELGKGSIFTVQIPSIDVVAPPEPSRDTRPRIPILRRTRLAQDNHADAHKNGPDSPNPS